MWPKTTWKKHTQKKKIITESKPKMPQPINDWRGQVSCPPPWEQDSAVAAASPSLTGQGQEARPPSSVPGLVSPASGPKIAALAVVITSSLVWKKSLMARQSRIRSTLGFISVPSSPAGAVPCNLCSSIN